MNTFVTEETIKEELVKMFEKRVGHSLYAEVLKKVKIHFNTKMPFFGLNTELNLYVNHENFSRLSNDEKIGYLKFEIEKIALICLIEN